MTSKIKKGLISAVFIFLPIIDILRTTSIKDIELFNISLIEIVNIVLITSSFIICLYEKNFKLKKVEIVYALLLLTYLIAHSINIQHFNVKVYEQANPNVFIEIYYLFKTYLLPLVLLYVLWDDKKTFDKNYYLKICRYLILVISGSIVILNLFRFSYSSYSETNEYVINNSSFFDVFSYSKNFKHLFTMGLFPSANQIALVLVMLLPVNIYSLYDDYQLKNIMLVIIQITSMIIVGTKVAVLGAMIIVFVSFMMYLFFVVFFKEKMRKKYIYSLISIVIVFFAIFYVSPFHQKVINEPSLSNSSLEQLTDDEKDIYMKLDKALTNDEFIRLLNENSATFKIEKIFYDIYPIENDVEFWKTIAKRNRALNNDYRILKTDIINRIEVRNGNKYDFLFGMGYTINFMDIEKDYVYQYYLFGVLGLMLLICPYAVIFMHDFVNAFNKYNFRYDYCLSLISACMGLVLCYFSGHLFGWTTPMMTLSLVLAVERERSKQNESKCNSTSI